MEEKDYNIKVTFSISYDIEVGAENKEDAIRKAIDYAFEYFSEDLRGNIDAGDFGVEAEEDE